MAPYPKKLHTAYDERREKNHRMKGECPSHKNYQHQFPKNIPQNMVLTFKDCIKARKDFSDKQ